MSRRRRGRSSGPTKQDFCDMAARNALIDAAKSGFRFLNQGDPIANTFRAGLTPDQLKTDLAARQIEHTLEAWHYLSQAAVALLSNQGNIAIHLAYYSEVRAANALLASTGISNKETPSHYIDSQNAFCELNVPTHELIRTIWSSWSLRPDSAQAFTSLPISPSVTLQDIGDAIGMQNIQSQPLQKWGFELVGLSIDHLARNNASYNVTKAYTGIPTVPFKENVELLKLIWGHLRPSVKAGQCQLEILYAQYLIWGQCIAHSRDVSGTIVKNEFDLRFNGYIDTICKNTGASRETLSRILATPIQEPASFRLFDLAAKQKSDPQNILARAAILCRLASNKLNNNIQLTQCTQALEWIRKWLLEAGIVLDGDEPSDKIHQMDDYEDAANEVANLTVHEAWKNAASFTHLCSRFDHALCWAIDYELA